MKTELLKIIIVLLLPLSLNAKCLRVATTQDYYPFSYINSSNKLSGIDIDLIKIIAHKMNRKICWVKTSWKSLIQDSLNNKYDIAISGISITKERQKRVHFSIPYYKTGKMAVFRCTNHFQKLDIKELQKIDQRIIFNIGGTNEKYAKSHFTTQRHIKHSNNLTISEELIQNRADLFVTDSVEAKHLSQNPKLCRSNTSFIGTITPIGIITATNAAAKRVNKLLKSVNLKKLYAKYVMQ